MGAEVLPGGGVDFRVWAPARKRVDLVIEGGPGSRGRRGRFSIQLAPGGSGYFSGVAPGCGAGTLYRYRLDGENPLCPDPASRFQPEGPNGPSQVIDPAGYRWKDRDWAGVKLEGQVIYEMHIGTFTREGKWTSAGRELPELARLGITVLEIMPVADFAGRFGWGYDGVDLFAPTRLYGEPDDFRRFVDLAHASGIGVILDVVYNHLGPDGNYLPRFSPDYFTRRHKTDWGKAVRFYGRNAGPVREFFLANAGYWIDEFHLDGLRIDATQNIYDESKDHILAAISRRVREAARGRSTLVIAENEPQESKLVRPAEEGGYGLDALWNDDFHHSAMVALSGHSEAYYTDYRGAPQEFISAVKWGYLYQGQWYSWQDNPRGEPALDLIPAAFVNYIQNHDQVANSAFGYRSHLLTSPGRYRAMTALLLLAPGTPMLFQGQEFAASCPFLFFSDHREDLAGVIRRGRAEFLSQFRSIGNSEMLSCLTDPGDPDTFERSKLDLSERERHAHAYDLHRDLLRLRREDPAFRAQRKGGVDGAVLAAEAFVLRFFGNGGEDRLLIVNLGPDLHTDPAPEPLLAPPAGTRWQAFWSSESPRYGGCGSPPLEAGESWRIPGHAAIVLRPERTSPRRKAG